LSYGHHKWVARDAQRFYHTDFVHGFFTVYSYCPSGKMRLTRPHMQESAPVRILRSSILVLTAAIAASSWSGAKAAKPQVHFQLPQGQPVRLVIHKLQVTAPVERVAFRTLNDLHAPYRWGDVAWYDRGPRPGEQGRASIYGHLDSTCCPAIFYRLRYLKKGDTVQVQYPQKRSLTFRVLWQGTYLNSKLPIKWMYSATAERGLVLMTCAGAYHTDGTGYDHKLIVYARVVLPNGKLG